MTYFIYCPDTNKILSRSNIRSADPFRGGIVNKRLDPDDKVSVSPKESTHGSPPFSDSGEIIKEKHFNLNSGEPEKQDSGEPEKKHPSGEQGNSNEKADQASGKKKATDQDSGEQATLDQQTNHSSRKRIGKKKT